MSAGSFTGILQVSETGPKAHFYVSKLGRWSQPDEVVSNPLDPQTLNRLSYALNSPVVNIDPSGNIVICFYGGLSEGRETKAANLCAYVYGERFSSVNAFSNSGPSVERALARIVKALLANPNEEVIIVGYSWGGAAAMELASLLMDKDITVDELLFIDPIFQLRMLRSEYSHLTPIADTSVYCTDLSTDPMCVVSYQYGVPENVLIAYNFYATRSVIDDLTVEDATELGLAIMLTLNPPATNIEGAINIGVDEDHTTIIDQGPLVSLILGASQGGGGGGNVRRFYL